MIKRTISWQQIIHDTWEQSKDWGECGKYGRAEVHELLKFLCEFCWL